jgi:alkanesulfonate monooxygenase SsuD/methylene tetrahydromethanopterin reductase-like flavin-dependent oxidoreductase (luciferase family)
VSPLRIGLVLPMSSTDAGALLKLARHAEELGFDGLFAFDHFFPPRAPSDRPSLEAYATLAAVAAVTSRVRIGTLVTRASLRPAGLLAKQAAALDDVSGGRFVLGIGTGDEASKAEHDVFGLPYLGKEARRAHLIETVRAVRALFAGEAWPGGEHVPAMGGPPLPAARPGGPPIWIGGESEAVARIAAREAEGWNGWSLDEETFAARVRLLRAEADGRPVEPTWAGPVVVGRDARDADRIVAARRERGSMREAFAGDLGATAGWLERLAEAGASWAILLAVGGADRIDVIGEGLLPHLAVRA